MHINLAPIGQFVRKARFALTGAVLGVASGAMAEGAAPSIPAAFDTQLGNLQTNVVALVEKFAPFVVAIITALLVLVGLDYAWRIIRSKL